MKFRLWEAIVLISLFVFAVAFALLNSIWTGFVYFTSLTLLIFIAFFINNRIYYIKSLKNDYNEGIEMYFAELYNNGMITKEQFDKRDERITSGYFKDFEKSKSINILIIVGLIIFSLTIILTIFKIW